MTTDPRGHRYGAVPVTQQARGESVDAAPSLPAGGVLFELRSGTAVRRGQPVSVAYQHVREDPKAPSDINARFRRTSTRSCSRRGKNPLNRYQSAQEMVPTPCARRRSSGHGHPVMSEAETMAMSGPPMHQQTAMTRAIPANGGPRGPRPPERKTSSWVMAVLAALGVLAVVALGIGLVLSQGKDDPDPPATAAVPKVTNLSESAARDALIAAGFSNITVGDPVGGTTAEQPGRGASPEADGRYFHHPVAQPLRHRNRPGDEQLGRQPPRRGGDAA